MQIESPNNTLFYVMGGYYEPIFKKIYIRCSVRAR